LDSTIALGNHTYIWGVNRKNPLLQKHKNPKNNKFVCNQGLDAPECKKVYVTQYYTYANKKNILLRAPWLLGWC
jgi:hypothetical protein